MRLQLITLFRQQVALAQCSISNKVHSTRKRIVLLLIAGGLAIAGVVLSALWLCMALYMVLRSVRVAPLHAAWLAPMAIALVSFFAAALTARAAQKQSHR
jgi:hypothetical protein